MALSTEQQNLVWQKAKIALDTLGATWATREGLRKLKEDIQAKYGNIDLQFVPIADLTADVPAADVPCKVYAIFLKKQATGTDAYYKAFNDAATDSSAEDALIVVGLTEASEQVLVEAPAGKPFSAGLTHGSFTAATGAAGTTASTSGDGPNGFVILGAA